MIVVFILVKTLINGALEVYLDFFFGNISGNLSLVSNCCFTILLLFFYKASEKLTPFISNLSTLFARPFEYYVNIFVVAQNALNDIYDCNIWFTRKIYMTVIYGSLVYLDLLATLNSTFFSFQNVTNIYLKTIL